jgi:hypothetical protein
MSLLQGATQLRWYFLQDPITGRPPTGLASGAYELYGAASTVSGNVLQPLVARTPTYSAATGIAQVMIPATAVAQAGTYREDWSFVDLDGNALGSSRLVLAVEATGRYLMRYQLRHAVAELLDDLWLGTVQSATTTTITDPNRTEAEWRHAWLACLRGQAQGEERRVVGWDQATGTFTTTPWVVSLATGDQYELHRRFSLTEYNRAIAQTLFQIGRQALVTVLDSTVLVPSDTAVEVALPSNLVTLARVWRRLETATAQDTDWQEVPLHPRTGAYVLRGQYRLRLPNARAGERLRLLGQILPQEPRHDFELVDVPADYLVLKTAAHLASQLVTGAAHDVDAWAQRAALFHNQAERIRPQVKPLPGSMLL